MKTNVPEYDGRACIALLRAIVKGESCDEAIAWAGVGGARQIRDRAGWRAKLRRARAPKCQGPHEHGRDGQCEEVKDGWSCTRPKGHAGDHIACSSRRCNLCRWPSAPCTHEHPNGRPALRVVSGFIYENFKCDLCGSEMSELELNDGDSPQAREAARG